MKQFSENFLNIFQDISKNLEAVPFWKDFSFLSVVVLALTLYWLIRYTRATEKILQNQITPTVEVNMLYNKESKETYFWFSNSFEMPAFVDLVVTITKSKKVVYDKTLRIPPNIPHLFHFRHTAGIGLYKGEEVDDKTEVTVDFKTRSTMKNSVGINEYRKSYKFNKDNQEWYETTWSYPDPPFPSVLISKSPKNNGDQEGSKM
ncbi:MAG: hypothetical protein HYS78_02335 [Parcubacteria group bacterium]|nr:hypothetical protein [Parcubacteria group bacterium]